ncbi:MAG: 6,7-dimethyl-8-ribityllumazine synthase [Candidatus Micrarchaeia archaeon]|jgi:6,7-dimethyl-8-ribityllumazine synthase
MTSIAVVASEFNQAIVDEMLKHAIAAAKKRKITIAKTIRVPGAYDAPLAVKKLLERRDISAVAVIGAIITGETKHDELIAGALANALTALSLQYEKPVTLGVIGPGATYAMAKARAKGYAERAVTGAGKMAEEVQKI